MHSLKILCFKAVLFNRNILFKELDLTENEPSKEEFLIESYQRWGSNLLSHLDGEFAFALYDAEKKHYFAARDPLGVKALYYTKIADTYYFSSNIDALLNIYNVVKKTNLTSMHTMLYQRTVDYSDTMYEGIYRLPPGHFMIIKDNEESIERYWYPEKIKTDYKITEKEAAQKLKKLFGKAVNKSIVDLEETAFEVSGGLDSSSVVSLLAQNRDPHTIESYSMEFKDLKCDEGIYVEDLLEQYPLHHQKIPSHQLDYHEKYALKHLYDMSPHWPITQTFAMTLPMLEKMKQDGKNVVITGQGGDHLFTGSQYVYSDLFRRFKFLMLYRELKLWANPWAKIKSTIIKPLLGKKLTGIIMKILAKEQKDPFLNKERSIVDLSDKVGIHNIAFKNELDMVSSAGQSTIMDGNLFHATETYFDIEFRHPYFDRELVEFALSLPPEMKYKQRTIKWILRKAMDGVLPDKIRDRQDKAEFSELLTQQIDAIDLDALLTDPYIVKLGLIEQPLIDSYRKEYENKTVKYILFLWTIINIEYWYRYNFEEESLIIG